MLQYQNVAHPVSTATDKTSTEQSGYMVRPFALNLEHMLRAALSADRAACQARQQFCSAAEHSVPGSRAAGEARRDGIH